jgi:2-methylcitrate dehydratase PrpD
MSPGSSPLTARPRLDGAYRVALLDWLACAAAGAREPAARCARAVADGLAERVLAAGTAGHVLDFDDTYTSGLAHLSAPTAPVALVLGAELRAPTGELLSAYAAGFEAMAALARACHPALYERGWHPTAVCGAVGSAVTAAALLGHRGDGVSAVAARLALAQAGGLRRSFGSDAKSLQVGAAAAAGVRAARMAVAGAGATPDLPVGPGGFEEAFGGSWVEPVPPPGDGTAIAENWIKAYPCCLQTHASIEAAGRLREQLGEGWRTAGPATVRVHPRARQAAPYDDVTTGLAAKFSIPYTVAFTLLHGPPVDPSCFASVEPRARRLAAERVRIELDATLPENAAALVLAGHAPVEVDAPLGSPANPMDEDALAAKVRRLAGDRFGGVFEAAEPPYGELLALISG